MAVKEETTKTREGLPAGAFAIVGDTADSETWKLLHHGKSISRAQRGKLDIEETVDWAQMPMAVAALSLSGSGRRRVDASPEQILQAAKHLANHYRKAEKPLPDTLAALV